MAEGSAMEIRRLALAGLVLLAAGLLLILVLARRDTDVPADRRQRVAAEHPQPVAAEVAAFMAEYNAAYRPLWTAAETARWQACVDIGETTSKAAVQAVQALADYTGSWQVIDRLLHLRRATGLDESLYRQVEKAWELAAYHPGTAPATARKLIQAEAGQSAALHGYRYRLSLSGQPAREVSLLELERSLAENRDLAARRTVWETGSQVGTALKDGLAELQELRNAVARKMGFSSYFSLACADYGLSAREMILLMDDLHEGLRPLYEQLHCWVRHELAARYGQSQVPRMIPIHWLPERWGRSWPHIVHGIELDGLLREVSPQWLVEQAERFYMSLGLPALPLTYWGRSDLFELPPEANRRKDSEDETWHIDLDQDVRSLMCVRNDFRSWRTAHHQVGRAYYCLSYARPAVPPILRRGANRGFHAAVGALGELACTQVPYLQETGLLRADQTPDRIRWLLNQALTGPVVLLPFACGTVAHWEHDFYETDLPRHLYNERWWRYAAAYQGLAPPAPRGEDHCDPAALPQINEQPARIYDLALSHVIAHQLHRYICRQILQQDVHEANYQGQSQVGLYLDSILAAGATRDWNQLLLEATGEILSASAMLAYYEPLLVWLRRENAGRTVGWQ